LEEILDTLEIEELVKKIKALTASIKGISSSPKKPSVKTVSKPTAPKAPSAKGPRNLKDGVKVAEQIGDKEQRKDTLKTAKQNKKAMTFDRNGQWSLK